MIIQSIHNIKTNTNQFIHTRKNTAHPPLVFRTPLAYDNTPKINTSKKKGKRLKNPIKTLYHSDTGTHSKHR